MSGNNVQQERAACIVNWLHNVNKRTYAEYGEVDSKRVADSSSNRMPTPNSALPSQDRRRDASPTKKRKVLQNSPGRHDDDSRPSNNDSTATPSSQGVPLRVGRPELPPSSASSSKGSKRSPRRSSPVKRKQALIGLENPVRFNELYAPTEQLPTDVQPLYSRIRKVAQHRAHYLPVEDRERLSRAIGEELPEFSFQEAASPSPAVASQFDDLQEILFTGFECQKLSRSELAVNMLVHGPLLNLALKYHHYVDGEMIQSARISPSFMPPLADIGDSGDATVTGGKMVDLALVLTPAADGSRALGRPPKGNKNDTAADEKLLRAIQTHVLHREPLETQSINQTTYAPVMFRPIAISIETKAEGSAEEGKLQLGVWTSAWYRRMISIISKLEQSSVYDSGPSLYSARNVGAMSVADLSVFVFTVKGLDLLRATVKVLFSRLDSQYKSLS
ncbi:hypothetical protein CCM_09097 [Cordyceps militaris CM01]|uniref:PD-(D/E)XK nuclease-like domain-containing protein n=1 Tax=Cordyceps militaris (strain CM01) TaxID=983644 RepID=G3JT53_CORMM|nr:uncharacterized protein CCM_09097 [Cordyceps militaris CM01]EGX89049.1 hypothetical protein CCM_09097 [Cordyceps militaris CM01]